MGIGRALGDVSTFLGRLRRQDWLVLLLALVGLVGVALIGYIWVGNIAITGAGCLTYLAIIYTTKTFRYIRHRLRADSGDEDPWRTYFDN